MFCSDIKVILLSLAGSIDIFFYFINIIIQFFFELLILLELDPQHSVPQMSVLRELYAHFRRPINQDGSALPHVFLTHSQTVAKARHNYSINP